MLSRCVWRCLEVSGGFFWGYLEVSVGDLRCLGVSGRYGRCLGVSGGVWMCLEVSGGGVA